MPIQRKGGITLSLMTNGGEVEWLARDLLQAGTDEGLKFFNDEYVEIMNRYPGEFVPAANAHALEEACRPIVEEMIRQGGAKAIGVQLWRRRGSRLPRQPQGGMAVGVCASQ